MKGSVAFMFYSKKDREHIKNLQEDLERTRIHLDNMRDRWDDERKRVVGLQKQLEDKEAEHRVKIEATMAMVREGNQHLTELILSKRENMALRQILEDITGKSADELIKAHERAIRLLEYGVEAKDGISEDCER